MRRLRGLVVRRLAWLVATAWFVMTVVFLVATTTPDPNIPLVKFAAGPSEEAQREAVEAYRELHNYDVPLEERYVQWMVDYATLDWGETLRGEPVIEVIEGGLAVTLTYLGPALVLSTVLALAIGLYVATHRGGSVDRVVTALAYGGYGVPVFFAGEMLFAILVNNFGVIEIVFDNQHALYSPTNIDVFAVPAAIMTAHLFVVQLILVRAELIENLNAAFMKTLVANGARTRDLARHALKNAAIPLSSAFFAEVLTLLYLSVIVIEVVFDLPGFGQITFDAIEARDVALILGTTFVPLTIGIVGNFLQDIAYTVIDPRVDYEDR